LGLRAQTAATTGIAGEHLTGELRDDEANALASVHAPVSVVLPVRHDFARRVHSGSYLVQLRVGDVNRVLKVNIVH
jgi:hypothetical protein